MENMEKVYELLNISIKSIDEESKTITAIGSKETIDRDGDVVKLDGMDLKNFKRNPVVLWTHNAYDLPIGRAEKVWVDNKKLMFKIKFASAEENPKAEYVYKLFKGGYLNAFSIGFRPDYETVTYKEVKGKQVRYINNSELFEISAVNIPANTAALIQSIDKAWNNDDIDGSELKELQEMLNVKVEEEDKDKIINDLKIKIKELELQLEEKDEEPDIYDEIYEEYKPLVKDIKEKEDIIDELIEELK